MSVHADSVKIRSKRQLRIQVTTAYKCRVADTPTAVQAAFLRAIEDGK